MTALVAPVLTWVDVDGPLPLTEEFGVIVLDGPTGLDSPPLEVEVENRTYGDGSTRVSERWGSRMLGLPLLVEAERVRSRLRQLVRRFAQGGRLMYNDGVAVATAIDVFYEGGLEGEESVDRAGVDWRQVTLVLRCEDPWWYAPARTVPIDPTGRTLSNGAGIPSNDPTVPSNGGPTFDLEQPGDVSAYPVFRIVGPYDSLTVKPTADLTLGWSIAAPLAAGEEMLVSAVPGQRGPSKNGEIRWSYLTEDSRLFSVPRGTSSYLVAVSGEDSSSVLSASYQPRQLAP